MGVRLASIMMTKAAATAGVFARALTTSSAIITTTLETRERTGAG